MKAVEALRPRACSLLALLALAPAPQEPAAGSPPAQEDLYPPARVATALRFYALSGDEVDAESLAEAARELGDGGQLAYGPVNTKSRPDTWFVALAAPAAATDKAVLRAAKEGTGKAEELRFTAFVREPGDLDFVNDLPRNAGSVRDLVVNMASEMRWFEATPGGLVFFYVNGLDGEECADRFDKLGEKKPRKDFERRVVRHSVAWALAAAREKPEAGSKVEDGLQKLPGVQAAALDPETLQLRLTLAIADLRVSGPPWTPPPAAGLEEGGGGRGTTGNRMAFMPRVDVDPLLEALADGGLAPAPAAPPPAGGSGPGGG